MAVVGDGREDKWDDGKEKEEGTGDGGDEGEEVVVKAAAAATKERPVDNH